MPPNTLEITGFLATFALDTYDDTTGTITRSSEYTTVETTLQTASAAQITSGSAEIVGENDSSSATDAEYQFTVTMVNSVPKNAIIEIDVPIDSMIPGGSASAFTLTCDSGCDGSGASFSYASPTLTITDAFLSYVDPGTDLIFTIQGWTNPDSATTVDFEVKTIYEDNGAYYDIDEMSGFTISSVEGECDVTLVNVTDGDYRIWVEPENYTFIMTCNHDILAEYGLRIIPP